jgi:hypothetical protein
VGYGHNAQTPGAGKGGIIALLHPRWKSNVTQSGLVMGNRVQWIILQGLLGEDLGLVNLYASNDSAARSRQWEALMIELPTTYKWILAIDFNMVEHRKDKTNQCGRMIPLAERVLFNAMKIHLQVGDNLCSPNSQKFNWNNLRNDGSRVLARLDRIYVFHANGTMARKLVLYKICRDVA